MKNQKKKNNMEDPVEQFEKELQAIRQREHLLAGARTALGDSPESKEAMSNIKSSLEGVLEDWKSFIENDETIDELKRRPEWNKREETYWSDVIRKDGIDSRKIIPLYLFCIIDKEVVIPVFAQYLQKVNHWDHGVALDRSREFIEEYNKTEDENKEALFKKD